jgi:hypothetical protein
VRLVAAFLARNEASSDRYLRRCLQNAKQWCDAIVVLDDRSTDLTASVCRDEGAIVTTRSSDIPAWGHESHARKELWDLAVAEAGDGWVLFQDCDMELSADPRPLCETTDLNTWAWSLLDLWNSEDTHRVDGYWQGSRINRPWLVKPSFVPEGWTPEWPARGIHCGHLPMNWPMRCGNAPKEYVWRHLAYLTKEHRLVKHAAYLTQMGQLTDWEYQHADSILDGDR